jgi:hypothetical protein
MQRRLGRRVRVIIEGPRSTILVDLTGELALGQDLGTAKPPVTSDAPVYFTFRDATGAFVLDQQAFVSAQELYEGRLLRVEQVGDVAFMIESG